jgi:hypothetical protein
MPFPFYQFKDVKAFKPCQIELMIGTGREHLVGAVRMYFGPGRPIVIVGGTAVQPYEGRGRLTPGDG